MSSNQAHTQKQIKDNVYLKVWQIEQSHMRMRWTVVTFFWGISFAILGFSFPDKLSPSESLSIRISGLFIYWFAYVLLLHFYTYTRFLRTYLIEMEKSGRTNLDIQGKADINHLGSNKRLSTTRLLFFFGLIYTVGIILLWLLGL